MRKLLFVMMAGLVMLIGVYPLLYAFVEHKHTSLNSKSPEILHNMFWRTAFWSHIIFGGLALFIGWRQFGSLFRSKYVRIHRILGRIYAIAVVISSVSAIYLGFYANGGIISAIGFVSLGLIWLMTTIGGVVQARNANVILHNQSMTYSYACTFAAVTLRLWYPLLKTITGDPAESYIAVAWLCWVPNLLIAYFLNRRSAQVAFK